MTDDIQASLEGHRVFITGAVAGLAAITLREQGLISVSLSSLTACSPVYASTAPQDLSGAAYAVPVTVCSSSPAGTIGGIGLVMPGAANICCTILPGDVIRFVKKAGQAQQIGIVAGIAWPEDRPMLCSRQGSKLQLQILAVGSQASSGAFQVQRQVQRQKTAAIPFSAVLSTACLLSEDEYSQCFPCAAHACPAVTCLRDKDGKLQELRDELAGLKPSWKRLEVLVQSVGDDQQVQSAICRYLVLKLASSLPHLSPSHARRCTQTCLHARVEGLSTLHLCLAYISQCVSVICQDEE